MHVDLCVSVYVFMYVYVSLCVYVCMCVHVQAGVRGWQIGGVFFFVGVFFLEKFASLPLIREVVGLDIVYFFFKRD